MASNNLFLTSLNKFLIDFQVGLERELDRRGDVRRDARHRAQQVHCQPQRQQKHDWHQAKILAKCYGSHSSTFTGLHLLPR